MVDKNKKQSLLHLAILLGILGIGVTIGIIAWSGAGAVIHALSKSGYAILAMLGVSACAFGFWIFAWRILLTARKKPSYGFFLYVAWIRAAINNLLPVAKIGGEIVAVRLMSKMGMDKVNAIAITVVEVTVSTIGMFFFALLGAGIFAFYINDKNIEVKIIFGLILMLPSVAALLFIQRIGLFKLLEKIFTTLLRGQWRSLVGDSHKLDRAVHALYRHHGRVITAMVFNLLAWGCGAVEIWVAAHFLDISLPFEGALMMEALIQSMNHIAFAVPGAMGVQEAGFLLFGHFWGIGPEIATALAILRRGRDLILYIPALIAWQIQEGRWLIKAKKKST